MGRGDPSVWRGTSSVAARPYPEAGEDKIPMSDAVRSISRISGIASLRECTGLTLNGINDSRRLCVVKMPAESL